MSKKGVDTEGVMEASQKQGYYFGKEEEQAVIDYTQAKSQEEKTRIFNEKLLLPFTKMIQSIIRRYKLYTPNEEFDEIFNDTMSFMLTKIDHFNPNSGYKAYSYCGTVCKNHLIHKIHTFSKNQQRYASYDTMEYGLSDNSSYSYSMKLEKPISNEMIEVMIKEIQDMVDHPDKYKMKENEIKVGKSLIYLFKEWENMFEGLDGSNKFNRFTFLYFMKEATLLESHEIRDGMRRFKNLYFNLKESIIDSQYAPLK